MGVFEGLDLVVALSGLDVVDPATIGIVGVVGRRARIAIGEEGFLLDELGLVGLLDAPDGCGGVARVDSVETGEVAVVVEVGLGDDGWSVAEVGVWGAPRVERAIYGLACSPSLRAPEPL
jgi:hypothetical protein